MREPAEKILILTRKFPYHQWSGASMRNNENKKALERFAEVRLFHIELPGTSFIPADARAVADVHTVRSPFSRANLPLLLPGRTLADMFYEEQIADALDAVLRDFQPTKVLMEELWLHKYIPIIKRRGIPLIVDLHNIETNVYRDVVAQKGTGFVRGLRGLMLLKAATLAEEDCLLQADAVWVCSDIDAEICRAVYPHVQSVTVVPNVMDQQLHDAHGEKSPEPSVLFCANFFYLPNRNAAEKVLTHVLPRLRKELPSVQMLFVGQGPSRTMMKASVDPAIVVTSAVPDVQPYLRSAWVSIAPLLVGGGTRLKILESMAAGCPVVSSSKGAEGLNIRAGIDYLSADDPVHFAVAVTKLCKDAKLREAIIASALERIHRFHSPDVLAGIIKASLSLRTPTPA